MDTSKHTAPRRYWLWLRESDPGIAVAAMATQEAELRPGVAARGGIVTGISRDDGYSGMLLERPAVDEIEEAAAAGKMDAVIATSKDRVFRGAPEQGYYFQAKLAQYGIALEYLQSSYVDDGESVEGALISGIDSLLPSLTHRAIVKKFREGLKRVAEEGLHWSSNPKYGHMWVATHERSALTKGRWEIVPSEAHWVRQMYLKIDAGWSLGRLARWLNAEHAPTRKGGKWWSGNVGTLLRHPMNKGEIIPHRYVAVQAKGEYEPRTSGRKYRRQAKSSTRLRPEAEWGTRSVDASLAIVDAALWERVVAKLDARFAPRPPRTANPSFLHGMVYCGEAHFHGREQRLCFQGRTGKPHYWRCPCRASPNDKYCKTYIRKDRLEAAVWDALQEMETHPQRLLSDYVKQMALEAERQQTARRALALVQAEVTAHQDALARLDAGFYAGRLDQARYERATALLVAELAQAQRDERASQRALDDLDADPSSAAMAGLGAYRGEGGYFYERRLAAVLEEQLGAQIRAVLTARTTQDKHERTRALIDRVVVDAQGGYLVVWLPQVSGAPAPRKMVVDADRLPMDEGDRASGKRTSLLVPLTLPPLGGRRPKAGVRP